jgi:hypothetical protein
MSVPTISRSSSNKRKKTNRTGKVEVKQHLKKNPRKKNNERKTF